MERLEKLINILKLTPHRQPELVKEATHRILSRSIRTDPLTLNHLKPLIEILIQYCDNDDSAQRSLFNDHLNSVILTFQHQYYKLIFQVLLDEVANNGSARSVTAALQRIPYIIRNVQPIDIGCEPQKLLKALIEVSRRSDDESVLRALDLALKHVMPYLDHSVRKSRELFDLSNFLVESLMRNLQNESSQTRRLAASSISSICSNSELQLKNTLAKLKNQLESLNQIENLATNKLVGFCLCVKKIPELAEQNRIAIIEMLLKQIESYPSEITLVTAALETLRELFKFNVDQETLDCSVKTIVDHFLISEIDGTKVLKKDSKIILQANALACLAIIMKQRPTVLDELEPIFQYRDHPDVAIRNQLISIIGNHIEASWRFPFCVEQSVDCEKIRKLWVELRTMLNDDNAHPDILKSCVIAFKTCVNTLLESDHCLHIIEYHDFDNLIQLYLKTNFKPFKIEVLSLFASLNYRTLYYLERSHWSRMKARTAGSFIDSLQDRIVSSIIIASLVDENQRIRVAATAALVTIIPNLYISNLNNGFTNNSYRSSDPIVSLAQDLSSEHLVVLKQADEHINHSNYGDEPTITSESHDKKCIRNDHKFLSSSIVQSYGNPYNERAHSQIDKTSQHRFSITINLKQIVNLLKLSIEDSLDKGKTAISSIVRALYELSLVYPVYQYSVSWDCRASEYCECFTLLNFLLSYLENITDPDVVVEDLEAYKNFLALCHQLLHALCHESVLSDHEHQKMKPYHKRQAETRDGEWSELTIKHPSIADILDIYFTHLTKLLWLISYIIEERTNPFNISSKQTSSQQQKNQPPESLVNHGALISNRLLFGRVHKKLESSFKSSKKNLDQHDEKFYQILETCLASISSLLEFIGMNKSMDYVKDILGYLKITYPTCSVSSLVCARQLLKSLFGINILALYQLDPNDWFEDEAWPSTPSNMLSSSENPCTTLQGVYHHLVANPYKVFSSYYSMNCSQITPTSDEALAILNFESRRALKVRRRIEDRIKSLFEFNPHQLVSPKVRQISELLKNTIVEFTPIVNDCMNQFNYKGFCRYQSEILHFMSYLILVRVNYQKLPLAGDLINSINKLLDQCGEKVFAFREHEIEAFLRDAFTFLILLSYERGPSKPMFQVATVIQKLDDLRAKLSMTAVNERDITTYIVPLLRCLVEDLFIYRTMYFQRTFNKPESSPDNDMLTSEKIEPFRKDMFELLEAERETVAQKLLDIIDNPKVYDLLPILILESRQNSSEIKYKKLSQQLLSIIPTMLSKRTVNLMDYSCVELARRIIENISPEVFQPVNFIFETLLEVPQPTKGNDSKSRQQFRRWMSLVIIAIHILITQVKEEVFLTRLHLAMSDEEFVEYLLHIAQLCMAEIFEQLYSHDADTNQPSIVFLSQQLSSYILYLTHMFQTGLFYQLSTSGSDFMAKEVRGDNKSLRPFRSLCTWARDPDNGFSLSVCEKMFYHARLIYPDLTIFWCNVMMLLNNVDCNRDYWRDLLVYECHHCLTSESISNHKSFETSSVGSATTDDTGVHSTSTQVMKDETKFKRAPYINRPSSLNLSDISFSDQLRSSFIKKIAAAESRDKAFNRNIIETSDEDGHLFEREVSIGNTEQCLSPNIELTRRGALCIVLDFVTINMNDVEHITWLIIHHINDIIRWSHENPITEFINAVHGNSASSGIFIQAVNSGFNNMSSMSFVSRLLWTLEQVHYTQYGSLVVLLVEKLLSSEELLPYRSLTKNIEDFACVTVQKLLNETNKSLVTTNDEVFNQLTTKDLDRIYSLLDVELYPRLTKLLVELRETTQGQSETPTIELHMVDPNSDEDSESDEIEVLYAKAKLVYSLAERNYTAYISTLIPALSTIKHYLSDSEIVERANKDEILIYLLVSAIYSLSLTCLPPPTRLTKPRFWSSPDDEAPSQPQTPMSFDKPMRPIFPFESKRPVIKPTLEKEPLLIKSKGECSQKDIIDAIHMACLKGLFLLENIDCLRVTQFEHLVELIIRLARLPLINSFILMPPPLWRQNIWPIKFGDDDIFKIKLPMVTHDILCKDLGLLENFCDRLLKLGWINRRQFEEAWMTLLGVLTTTLSQPEDSKDNGYGAQDVERKLNLLASCKVISTTTKLLLLTRKRTAGDPNSQDSYLNQSFDDRVIELTKSIARNLTSLRKKTQSIFETIELERRKELKSIENPQSIPLSKDTTISESQGTNYNQSLGMSAQELRMNAVHDEVDMQDTVVIASEKGSPSRSDEVDVESCVRLLLSIYKQKFKDPNENLCLPKPASPDDSLASSQQSRQQQQSKNRPNQLAPPLATAICQSIVALSDLFNDYEQFDWLFETFVQMFKLAERNEDEIQMQYLIIGLCKSAAVCCHEIPNELTTTAALNHRDVMFEKCRQSIEKCMKSEFGPLRLNVLHGVFYMLEDSIKIVASGAWELDNFKLLRQSRLTWILKLIPIILDKENSKLLTKRTHVMKLLESLAEILPEPELKAMKAQAIK